MERAHCLSYGILLYLNVNREVPSISLTFIREYSWKTDMSFWYPGIDLAVIFFKGSSYNLDQANRQVCGTGGVGALYGNYRTDGS